MSNRMCFFVLPVFVLTFFLSKSPWPKTGSLSKWPKPHAGTLSSRDKVSPSGSTFTCTTKTSRSPWKVLTGPRNRTVIFGRSKHGKAKWMLTHVKSWKNIENLYTWIYLNKVMICYYPVELGCFIAMFIIFYLGDILFEKKGMPNECLKSLRIGVRICPKRETRVIPKSTQQPEFRKMDENWFQSQNEDN